MERVYSGLVVGECCFWVDPLCWALLPMQAWDDQRRQLEGQRLISMGPKAIEAAI